jgi:hypothetical protein
MVSDKMINNDRAFVNIDLMFAIVLFIAAIILAIMVLPSLSHEDRDWRIMQYMAATRASDNLVQDSGDPQDWTTSWTSGNYAYVTKIGLAYADTGTVLLKVLDEAKVDALMTGYNDNATGVLWWEFPNSTTSPQEKENAKMALGLEGYNFYIQLHPVGLNLFDPTPLVTNLTNRSAVPINNDTVSVVDRYVYIKNDSFLSGYNSYNGTTIHYRLNIWVW